jgi:ketosteroid isomerase-like protein
VSGENVELIKYCYELFDARDVDAAVELAADDVDWRPYLASLRAEPLRGPAGVREFMLDLYDTFDEFSIERRRYVGVDDWVAVFCHSRGRGRESGAEIEVDSVHVWQVRDGKICRFAAYLDSEEALSAIGLPRGSAARLALDREGGRA